MQVSNLAIQTSGKGEQPFFKKGNHNSLANDDHDIFLPNESLLDTVGRVSLWHLADVGSSFLVSSSSLEG
ncbi:hypothetical protein NPIL_405501 [Nephila pilipes]|uniref:Uncharacterized protein n=1 Tax=Nephila pilipes TaxID=299642 RepID=A0A8X6PES0_NEPPI|nr:hypothetical protein NPIL_405501 [Nephila pilipes]